MLKTPLNVPQQLSQFQSHGVLVQDEAAALSILERVSYYRLSGYALAFPRSPHLLGGGGSQHILILI